MDINSLNDTSLMNEDINDRDDTIDHKYVKVDVGYLFLIGIKFYGFNREYSQFRKSHHHQSVPKLDNLPTKDPRFNQHAHAILYPHEYSSNNPDNSMYMRSDGFENGDGNYDNQNDAFPYNSNEYEQAQQRQSANDTGFESHNPFEPSNDQVNIGSMSYRSKC